ncbi:hypothetical protein WJX72_004856 [[Myrmecia] bisecta]|uniref:Nucleoside diphosphate kinase n=1 Tax=[Myrmecia] bisecta TaxID=41462 RepID=A0AAW1QRF5_9CHLO
MFASSFRAAARRISVRTAAAACSTAGRSYVTTAGRLLESSATSTAASLAVAAAATVAFAPIALAGSSPQERTFIMIKPDGVHRGLVADIIKRFEAKGYKLVGIKVLVPSKDLAGKHYAEHEGKPFYPGLVNFLSSGAVVAMVWEGKEVIKTGRTFIGATNPLASAPGTIRGDYGIDVGRNIIHGSDSVDSAQKEIALWFKPAELAEYELISKKWVYE